MNLGIYWRAVVLDRLFRVRRGGRGRPPSRKFPSSMRTLRSRYLSLGSIVAQFGNGGGGARVEQHVYQMVDPGPISVQ